MDTRRLLSGYLARLGPRLAKVLACVVLLYVFVAVVLTIDELQGGVDAGLVLVEFGRSAAVLPWLVGLGVPYAVLGPAFRQSERQVLKHGGDPASVRTAIRFGQNPLGYVVQSAVRAGVFVTAGFGALGANVRIEAGEPVTIGGAFGAIGAVALTDLLGIGALCLLVALVWPYTSGSSFVSESDARFGEDARDGGDGE